LSGTKKQNKPGILIFHPILILLNWYTIGATTFSILTFSITTLSIKALLVTLRLCDIQHEQRSITTLGHYVECHYAECRYAECRGALQSGIGATYISLPFAGWPYWMIFLPIRLFLRLIVIFCKHFGLFLHYANLLHFHLNRHVQYMVCCRYFKFSKVV
jgi:hypothetical protein